MTESSSKVQCHWCKKKLSSVFRVCRCKKYCCPNCIVAERHDCVKLLENSNILKSSTSSDCIGTKGKN